MGRGRKEEGKDGVMQQQAGDAGGKRGTERGREREWTGEREMGRRVREKGEGERD